MFFSTAHPPCHFPSTALSNFLYAEVVARMGKNGGPGGAGAGGADGGPGGDGKDGKGRRCSIM